MFTYSTCRSCRPWEDRLKTATDVVTFSFFGRTDGSVEIENTGYVWRHLADVTTKIVALIRCSFIFIRSLVFSFVGILLHPSLVTFSAKKHTCHTCRQLSARVKERERESLAVIFRGWI
jgi:hypothetical protein